MKRGGTGSLTTEREIHKGREGHSLTNALTLLQSQEKWMMMTCSGDNVKWCRLKMCLNFPPAPHHRMIHWAGRIEKELETVLQQVTGTQQMRSVSWRHFILCIDNRKRFHWARLYASSFVHVGLRGNVCMTTFQHKKTFEFSINSIWVWLRLYFFSHCNYLLGIILWKSDITLDTSGLIFLNLHFTLKIWWKTSTMLLIT